MKISRLPLLFALAGCTAFSFSMPVLAQQERAATGDDGDIVIEGRRGRTRDKIKVLLEKGTTKQLGRFEKKICPGVLGISADMSATFVRIIRENLEKAEIELDAEDCDVNALLVFSEEPAQLISILHEGKHELFTGLPKREIKRLKKGGEQIYSWQVIEQRGRGGEKLQRVTQMNGRPVGGKDGVLIVEDIGVSRIYERTRDDMVFAVAVIDVDAIEGKTFQQVADIATLHLALDIAPEAAERAESNSILTLFNERENDAAPERMSDLEFATLKNLYKIKSNNYKAFRQLGRVASMIEKTERSDAETGPADSSKE
ncbi:hypothetical protein [Sphingorhabdus sp. Alg239-R122]|uniref:hypothetical protein n=1 Tax=Sphingorhabdus sp. Alg239-R122 TaxID=2305989 RepID=UPI0013DC227E|nr:hypothetical protein [Sphingorhabdus sp. Alg239-R122]